MDKQQFEKLVIKKIEENFALKIFSLKRLKGFYDLNFYLLTNKGERFLKVYGKDNLPNVRFQVELVDFFRSKGFPVAKTLINSKGKVFIKIGTHYAILQEWIKGRVSKDSGMPANFSKKIGSVLARMHLATKNAIFSKAQSKRYVWDAAQFGLVKKDFPKTQANLSRNQIKMAKDVFNEWQKNKALLDLLPKGVCHNDFHGGNLLVSGNKLVGIVDFADALKTWYAADLAIALFFICYSSRNPLPFCKQLLLGYQKIRILSDVEKSVLTLLIKMRAVALLVEVPLEVKHRDKGFYQAIFKQSIQVLKFFKDKKNLQAFESVIYH